ncbi:M16 family metallopeptidase [Odoribacter splanchnicus]|uniref:M16 family metallopeptidase n=1 Tax=Odoribacter splanchnicus TaxID=28118 RepID=UPI000B5584D1|nr:pitrilysin family protein [Odoribacter splanchnicus]OUN96392.1 peptidase M16 [Odoribacter splanchnicus]
MNYLSSFSLVWIGMLLIVACQGEKDFSLPYEKFVLDNGLQVVLHEDKSDPIVSVAIQYHVGSAREKPGKTGFAHLFEHMLFQRSEHLGRNEFFKKIGELGGSFNGATGPDGTVYYETVPRDALEKVLWMESDRMGFFINTVTRKGLEREIDVVSNEKRQNENRPFGQSNGMMLKQFYPEGHPYRWPVIGSIADLHGATVDDIKQFYRKYYAPNNATLVVAGDFDRREVEAMIRKYFGEIPAREEVEPVRPIPVQLEKTSKYVLEDRFANAPGLEMNFSGAEQFHPDAYPLRILALLLSYGKNAPFYKVLVEDNKLASYVNVASSSLELSGQVSVSVKAYKETDLNTVYRGIQEAFERFEQEGIRDNDLERMKIMQETMLYNVMMSLESKTQALARNNVFAGRPDQMVIDLAHYQAVTKEEVMRVYRKYVRGKHFVALSTVPQGQTSLALTGSVVVRPDEDSPVGQRLVADEGAVTDDDPYEYTPSVFDRSVEPPLLANTPESAMPPVWTGEMSNGMKVKGMAYTELPVVQFAVYLNSGMLCEPKGKSGLARLTAAVLNCGTRTKTPEELEVALGLLGARVSFGVSTERMQLSGSCLKKNFPQVLRLVEEMLLEPRWDETALELARKRMIGNIRQSSTEPKVLARHVFRQMMYGPENVLSNSALASEKEVAAITMEDIKTFYKTHIVPGQATFDFVGGYEKKEVMKFLQPLARTWTTGGASQERLNLNFMAPQAKVYFVDYPGAKQSYILLGCPAMPKASNDYYPAKMVNQLLGASSNALLFDVLRLQHGYTYGAYSFFDCGKYANEFRATSSVQAAYTLEAMQLFKSCISTYGEQFTEQSLVKTKDAMFKENAAAFEMPDARLDLLSEMTVDGLPVDDLKRQEQLLKRMTLPEAKACIRNWLDYDRMFFVVVGDAASQLDRIRKSGLGEVKVVDLQELR